MLEGGIEFSFHFKMVAQLVIHNLKRREIYAFPKGISVKWNTNHLIKKVNYTGQVHLLQW